jgi:hypothetical protein
MTNAGREMVTLGKRNGESTDVADGKSLTQAAFLKMQVAHSLALIDGPVRCCT